MQDATLNELANLNKKIDKISEQIDFYFKKYFAAKAEEERKYFLESMSTEELAMFCKASDILRKQDDLRETFKSF